MFVVFLLALLVVSGAASPIEASCNANTLRKCFATYLNQFHLNSQPSIPDYVEYATARAFYLDRKAVPGQKDVCDWQHDLEGCLGADLAACMTAPAFEGAMGVSQTEAVEYQTDFFVQRYQCGAGYQTLIDNFYCLHTTRRDEIDEFRACDRQLHNNIDSGFKCSYYNTYINCERAIYTNSCGQGVSKFVCESKKASIQASTHSCDSTLLKC